MAGMKVGLIGAGNMGGPMVHRLLDQGIDVTVCDRNPGAVAPLAERGAKVVATARELADTCELVIASMPSRAISVAVALGDDGIVHGKSIRVYVETSTLG